MWHCSAKVKNPSLALLSQALALRVTMSLISKPPVPQPRTVLQSVYIALQHWAPETQTDTQTAVDMEVPPELKNVKKKISDFNNRLKNASEV